MQQLRLLGGFLLVILGITCSYSQGVSGKLRDEADRYFKAGQYDTAIPLYQRYLQGGGNANANKNLGIAQFKTNRLSEAESTLYQYYSANPKDLEAVYYLGQTFHHNSNFDKAIEFYKYYLSLTKPSNSNYAGVIAAIKQCGNALKIKYQDQLAIIENAGHDVNTTADEFNPIWSPNYFNRLYFTSNQTIDTSEVELPAGIYSTGNFNMFGSEVEMSTGILSKGRPLNPGLISDQNEELYGFSEDGKMLYFGRGNGLNNLSVFVENTNLPVDDANRVSAIDAPFADEGSIMDVFPFTQTILLISSDRPGGFGGYDLYYSEYKDGKWGQLINLGPEINTVYDERCPFLAMDGRTLYYSSNSLDGIGGYDVYSTYYLDKTMKWEHPVNLGMPINSPGDDMFFKLGRDGQKAILSSNRKSSLGGFDLYTGFFKEIRNEQQVEANPQVFFQVPAHRLNTREYQDELLASKIYAITIEPFYYANDDNIVQPKNRQQLDQIVQLAKKFPTATFNILVNTDANVSPEIELYFGIKRGEIFRNYMVSKGIEPSRIVVQSVGSLYPIAKNMINGKASISGQNLNRRIEISVNNIDSLPIKITFKQPFVSELLKADDNDRYKNLIKGLAYRVQFITLRQMYSGDIMALNSDLMIESQDEVSGYRYMAGLFKTYSEAKAFRETLINHGLKDAFIVPYIDNQRFSKTNIPESLFNTYPDLRKYYLDL